MHNVRHLFLKADFKNFCLQATGSSRDKKSKIPQISQPFCKHILTELVSDGKILTQGSFPLLPNSGSLGNITLI